MIHAILACDSQGGIARDGIMPWPRNRKDLQHFRKVTQNHTVVMGRGTWEAKDMPTPLPKRKNIVVTRNPEYVADGATIITEDVSAQIKALAENEKVFIIGGANLFYELIDDIDILHLTRIAGAYYCDRFLPLAEIEKKFEMLDQIDVDRMTRFETYIKKDIK